LLFNGWGVTPAGDHAKISDMPLKMLLSKDGKTLITVSGGYSKEGLTLLDVETRKVTQFLPIQSAFNGLGLTPDGAHILVTGGDKGIIHDFAFADGKATLARTVKPEAKVANTFLAGMYIQPDTGRVFVCNEGNDEIWALDPKTLEVENKIPVGEHPYACALGADKRHLYVSNWGSRSVTVVDTKTNKRVRDIAVGVRPNDMTLSKDGRLFVACSGDNTVHVIQTRSLEAAPEVADSSKRLPEGTREIISTSLYPQSPEGSTPDAVAVTPDGQTLFVANADNNCVMVVDISGRALDGPQRGQSVSMVNGFIPVGWYPCSLAVSADGQTLLVGNGKGLRSVSNVSTTQPAQANGRTPYRHIASTMEGYVSFIGRPDTEQIVAYTKQVRKNSPYTPDSFRHASATNDSIIPSQVGAQSCPIKHVLYIIKENRTYDQVFGDMKNAKGEHIGNGDAAITMYGEAVTPNQHELARQYVLLDNLYCNGEVSVDGHSWCDAAIATDFKQRSWILSYSKHGVLPGNAEMDVPTAGYLWDLCQRHGVSYRNYGEGAAKVPNLSRGKWVAGWGIRDMDRVKFWIDDLKAAERGEQELPRFTIMSLGENHTQGTTPGAHTPRACVASNDLAVARVVEAASNSKFWKEMAIFIIEDDAQNGPDHVDAHRTAGLVISPWCKRGEVDSTLYTTASMIRTMELILGLPPLTQYDAGATPMFNCFAKETQLVAFTAKTPTIDMLAKNTARSPRAAQSSRMNFKEFDRAPEDELNQILWLDVKGPDVPYPTPIHRAMFTAADTNNR
ncbi:MAG TPA: SMP-30/gluconolactonase/LRE family protein, partial [Tepidisphaeraceae bacterium]